LEETAGTGSQAAPIIELPDAARALLLKVVDASVREAPSWRCGLLSTAAQRACPDGAVDAMSRLLIRNWPSAAFRRCYGWESVKGMLECSLSDLWNACQVRLADALCEDVAIAQDVLWSAFSDAELQRDRCPTSQNTSLIGTAISFSPRSGIAGRPEQTRGGHGNARLPIIFAGALTDCATSRGRKTPAVLG